MVSLLRCLFRFCCDAGDDESDQQQRAALPPSSNERVAARMLRSNHDPVAAGYQAASQHAAVGAVTTESTECCNLSGEHNNNNNNNSEEPQQQQQQQLKACSHTAGIREFFRALKDRWRRYDSLETHSSDDESSTSENGTIGSPSFEGGSSSEKMPLPPKPAPSPLRMASTFDASLDIPTIPNQQVVLPGSNLQEEMARAAAAKSVGNVDDECVICMEGFDPTNPRMPTLCGCGENKTYFHLPCLYQWIEQSRNCPSCRKRLRWEEF